MTDLYYIQQQIVARIGSRPVGSASRFRLMNAADAVSHAIEAELREGNGSLAKPLVLTEQYVRPILADPALWAVGAWLSAALDDPNVCDDMKLDIREWFDSNLHVRPTRTEPEAPACACCGAEGAPDLSFKAMMETIHGKDAK